MARSRSATIARLTALVLPVLVAACFGGRGKRPSAPPPAVTPPLTAPDSAPPAVSVPTLPDSAKPVTPVNRDSLQRVSDSLTKALKDDSIKAAAAAKAGKAPAKKKTKECLLDTQDSPPESRFTIQQLPDSNSILLIGGGFVGHCAGENNTLKADSAEYFQVNGFVNLFGNVTYEEKGEFRVTALNAIYFIKEGRVVANGNVNALQIKSGSKFVGPNIEYFRVMPDVREESRLYAPNSPVVTIEQKDSTGKPLPPVRINAQTMEDRGDSTLIAWGFVNMQRTDVTGRSDSANYSKSSGTAKLMRAANIESTNKEQAFTLSADTIDMFSTEQQLNRVHAKHIAKAVSGELNTSAEYLDMRIVDRKIERAYAYGPGRAKAITQSQNLEADSLDIRMPNQKVRELRAFGTAVAIAKPDSMKMKSEENDVLRGDSVKALFDSIKVLTDTAAKAEVRQVTAMGNASSKVQIASRKGREFLPAINYIKGKHLVVDFDSNAVKHVSVDSAAMGAYYEPMVDSTLGDSSRRVPPRRPPGISQLRSGGTSRPSPMPTPLPAPEVHRASAAILPSRTLRTR
ncbi:MAG: hypothetical protein ACO1Q7_02650 [Gemmatimonas sp.]